MPRDPEGEPHVGMVLGDAVVLDLGGGTQHIHSFVRFGGGCSSRLQQSHELLREPRPSRRGARPETSVQCGECLEADRQPELAKRQPTSPQLRLRVNRTRAAELGISMRPIGRTLQIALGGDDISDFAIDAESDEVMLRAKASDRASPRDPAGETLNIFSQIGLILAMGLMAKNANLLVELANQSRDRGQDLRGSLEHAARTRFRPILMTSFATLFGGVISATLMAVLLVPPSISCWRDSAAPGKPILHPLQIACRSPRRIGILRLQTTRAGIDGRGGPGPGGALRSGITLARTLGKPLRFASFRMASRRTGRPVGRGRRGRRGRRDSGE